MNTISTITKYFFVICSLVTFSALQPKQTIVFDIHGVLLKEDLARLVEVKINTLLAQQRGLADNSLFQELCELMKIYKPLGKQNAAYKPTLGIPYEVYALFAGINTPDEVYSAITTMLNEVLLTPKKKVVFNALIDTIFDNAARTSALTPILPGINLFHTCLANSDINVFIYTNAPTEWIQQYKTLFPDVFSAIPDSKILTSGASGLVKPDKEVFTYLCQQANCTLSELILIDDSKTNIAAAREVGATGLLFHQAIQPELDSLKSDTTTAKTEELHTP